MTTAVTAALVVVLCASAAVAQPATAKKWEVTVEGAWLASSTSSSRDVVPLPAGTPFTTVVGRPGQRVPSWYFGDGARLLNDVLSRLDVQSRLTPLDPALEHLRVRTSQAAPKIGVRLGRAVTPRVSLEGFFEVDTVSGDFDSGFAAPVEAARSTFVTAMTALLETGPFRLSPVTSTATVTRGSLRQFGAGGNVNIALRTRGRILPYVSAGAGVIAPAGTSPEMALRGAYSFVIAGTNAPVAETDSLRIAVTSRAVPTGLVGLGARVQRAAWAIRADLRAQIARSPYRTTLTAAPSVVAGTPADAIATFTTPSLQFSNTGTAPSSLDHTTIEAESAGGSWRVSPRMSVGLSFRF